MHSAGDCRAPAHGNDCQDDTLTATLPGVPVRADCASVSCTWSIHESGDHETVRERHRAVFALGNGHLGVLGLREEDCFGSADSQAAVYLNGIFEAVPIQYHERFPGFATTSDTRPAAANPLPFSLRVGGEWLARSRGTWLEQERTLDLRSGLLTRRVKWRSSDGRTIELTFERMVSLARPPILASRVTISALDFDGEVELCSRLDPPPATDATTVDLDDPRLGPGFPRQPWKLVARTATDEVAALVHETVRSGCRTAVAVMHGGDATFVISEPDTASGVALLARISLRRGEPIRVEKVAAFVSRMAPREANELAQALAEAAAAIAAGFDALLAQHRSILDAFWFRCAIGLKGAPTFERAVRFSMFQLFQAAGRDSLTSIAAKGQTGRAYEGHYFWDAEVFCLPLLTYCAPAVARSVLEFRFRTLAAARDNARSMGHARGALFPWRTISGRECSAYFPAGTAQYHLNAGIAYAVRQYWEATADLEFLLRAGAELVVETARIWLEVGFFNARRDGQFCIPGVTGPDEYTVLVDNNFYTNAMAQAHLEFAASIAPTLQAQAPLQWEELRERLGIREEEISLWSRAARLMYLPYDSALGAFKQDDTFLDRKPWNFDAVPRRQHPLLLHFHPLVLYRHQLCKQADAVLALFLLRDRFRLADRRRTFEYYERLTTHDSALSPGIFSLVASDTGDAAKAFTYGLRTASLDLEDLHGNTRDGLHMAALGASWMSVVMGFAGMRLVDGVPTFRPTLPPRLQGYSFRLQVRGSVIGVDVDSNGTQYRLLTGAPVVIRHFEMPATVRPAAVVLFAGSARQMAQSPVPALARVARAKRAVIFDLDGVLVDTARLHLRAWRQLAEEIGVKLAAEAHESLKGVDRAASLEIVLRESPRTFDDQQKAVLAERKDRLYRESVRGLSARDVLPGARATLKACRENGLKIAVASSSRNAPAIILATGLTGELDIVVDGNSICRAKPHPEAFLRAASLLDVGPGDCIGIEDAVAGIRAIKSASMYAIGIGAAPLLASAGADAVIPSIAALAIEGYLA